MFTVTAEQRQYLTYVLADQSSQSEIEVVPERGGIVTVWRIKGQEMFYLDTERFTHPDLSVRGGIPILFPICGNLPDDTYTYQDQSYQLKQHGFARGLPWQVIRQEQDGLASLTVELTSNAETLPSYPFDFQVQFTYKLVGTTLTIQQVYTNRSAHPMPFSSGFHPYFAVTDKTQLQFQIPSAQFTDREGQVIPFQGSFDFSQAEIDVIFRELTGSSASVTDPVRKTKLNVNFDSHYSALVFWTVAGKDFYCLEPWTGPRNAMNTGDHLLQIDPGASLETVVSMSFEILGE